MAITIDDLFHCPDHYLHSYDGDDAVFVPMDREAYHRSIFLDGRISPAAQGTIRLSMAQLGAPRVSAEPINWIFHVAHCGSTLLSRALDRASGNLVLREPLALRQTAISTTRAKLDLVNAMLSKRYVKGLPTIVKANVPVNFLLPAIAALHPDAAAVLLYLPLPDYLLAVLRSENHRQWLRNVTAQLKPYLGDLTLLSDGERCAAIWLDQMRMFLKVLEAMPRSRALNAEEFFSRPGAVITQAADVLQMSLTKTEITEIVGGPLFETYSKNPKIAFDNDTRLAQRRETAKNIADEFASARSWVTTRAGSPETIIEPLMARSLVS